jgi:hypothetical protein
MARKACFAVSAAIPAIVLVFALSHQSNHPHRSLLLEVFHSQDLPTDPIVTPLMMGYNAEEEAANELSHVFRPLQLIAVPDEASRTLNDIRRNPYQDTDATTKLESKPSTLNRIGPDEPVPEKFPRTLDSHYQLLARKMEDALNEARSELVMPGNPMKALAKLHNIRKIMKRRVNQAHAEIAESAAETTLAEEGLERDRTLIAHEDAEARKKVKLLKRTQRLASLAQQRLAAAVLLDRQGTETAEAAATVLQQAHEAEVAAKVTGDRAALAAAEARVTNELDAVRHAESLQQRAAADRAAARRDARAANRARQAAAAAAAAPSPPLGALLAAEQADRAAAARATQLATAGRRTLRRAKQLRAGATRDIQREEEAAATMAAAARGLSDLRTAAADEATARFDGEAWRRAARAGRREAQAAAEEDVEAAELSEHMAAAAAPAAAAEGNDVRERRPAIAPVGRAVARTAVGASSSPAAAAAALMESPAAASMDAAAAGF